MARLIPTTYSEPADFSASRTPTNRGSFSDSSSVDRNFLNNNTIAEQVINSPAYKSAYEVLSQENDKSWLQRLEMIPYSVQDASSTFFDDLGLVSNQKDKQSANYQYCLEQISALMAEYQSWKNSLPVTQSQQFADAGINSAITGQGITNSGIPNVGVSTDPSQLSSANPFEVLHGALSFMLDTTTGISSVVNSWKNLSLGRDNLKLNQSQFIDGLNRYIRENGIHIVKKDGTPLSHIESYDDLSEIISPNDKGASIINNNLKIRDFFLNKANSEVIRKLYDMGYRKQLESAGLISEGIDFDDGSIVYTDDFTSWNPETTEFYLPKHVNDTYIKYLTLSAHAQSLTDSYNSDIAKYGVDSAEHQSIIDKYNKQINAVNAERADLLSQFIKKLADSRSPDSQALLMKIISGINYNDIRLTNEQIEGQQLQNNPSEYNVLDVIYRAVFGM